ncbi:hypothetical protein C1631_014735 [Chryseobacterium phosphatilyticum]|uniref:Uncharacterized protein n=1 Tax=Chryseobacterium phosphatilyticum TaxID=475075 RepID=A0A316XDB2_9FLAO|nr:DUF5829 family protein [Chryseobacterium phosphatilyticum]PWN69308.1 hypothetical protein C1631_014735 [Chryseobacterium phosphatilyticum]
MGRYFFIIFLIAFGNKVFGQNEALKVNHIYFVLDSVSFNEIRGSEQLAKWSSLDKGLPDFLPINQQSTTLYLRGKSTYIEVMGPDNRFGEKVGSVGIGFSWDTSGTFSDDIGKKLKNNDLVFSKNHAMWNFAGKEVLWYSAYSTALQGSIATWYAFYNQEFLTRLYHKKYQFFTREAFLERIFDQKREITDLSAIVLNCNTEDYDKLTKELDSFGIKPATKHKDSVVFQIYSVRITIILTPNKTSGIKELRLKTKNKLNKSFKLGKVNFRNDGKELIMTFN